MLRDACGERLSEGKVGFSCYAIMTAMLRRCNGDGGVRSIGELPGWDKAGQAQGQWLSRARGLGRRWAGGLSVLIYISLGISIPTAGVVSNEFRMPSDPGSGWAAGQLGTAIIRITSIGHCGPCPETRPAIGSRLLGLRLARESGLSGRGEGGGGQEVRRPPTLQYLGRKSWRVCLGRWRHCCADPLRGC